MARDQEDWPENVTPFEPRLRAKLRRAEPAKVTPLPTIQSESIVPWRGDEEWLSTLPDPHDTTRMNELE